MARDVWFETVAAAQERAKKRLPKAVYSALLAGSGGQLVFNSSADGQYTFTLTFAAPDLQRVCAVMKVVGFLLMSKEADVRRAKEMGS
jgi:hypothetical protein